MKKLSCHCGGVEAEVNLSEKLEKVSRCNCSICKKKGYIMTPVSPENFKLVKGQDLLTLYQYHTKVAKHYFCSKCGIHTHANPRSNPKIYTVNVACIEGVKPFELKNVEIQNISIQNQCFYEFDSDYKNRIILNLDQFQKSYLLTNKKHSIYLKQ